MKRFVVTFARGFGSGGKEIASLLAHDLGIHCYENRILTLASQLSGLDENIFNAVNEKIRTNGGFSGFLKGLPRSCARSDAISFPPDPNPLAKVTTNLFI